MNDSSGNRMDKESEDRISSLKEAFHHVSFLSAHSYILHIQDKHMEKGNIPLFIQWDKRWGKTVYGDGTIASNGCGPTALAMVIAGLTKRSDVYPDVLAEYSMRRGFYVPGVGSSWELMTRAALDYGLQVQTIDMDETAIFAKLRANHPIICSVGPGDFTAIGHFIVLIGIDKQGKILVHDSKSRIRSKRSYEFTRLKKQVRQVWVYGK